MLKQIPKILSPELVKYLMEMGHGEMNWCFRMQTSSSSYRSTR